MGFFMTIIRSPRKERNFTILSNEVCLDSRLSMRALGLLVRLLSRPDNWNTNSESLAREFGVGRDQVRNVLSELRDFGYMKLVKSQNASGQWITTWHVFDEPTEDTVDFKPEPENQGAGKPQSGESGPNTRTDLTRTDNKVIASQKPVNKATRLKEDFEFPIEWKQWANAERPDIDVDLELASFKDYWIAKSGADAAKTNWFATWRNWVRRAKTNFSKQKSNDDMQKLMRIMGRA
jgi:hypothetical protein